MAHNPRSKCELWNLQVETFKRHCDPSSVTTKVWQKYRRMLELNCGGQKSDNDRHEQIRYRYRYSVPPGPFYKQQLHEIAGNVSSYPKNNLILCRKSDKKNKKTKRMSKGNSQKSLKSSTKKEIIKERKTVCKVNLQNER